MRFRNLDRIFTTGSGVSTQQEYGETPYKSFTRSNISSFYPAAFRHQQADTVLTEERDEQRFSEGKLKLIGKGP